ncbi:hypothetical protein CR513_24531, partial [Mucuna pruriens]
MDWHSEIPATCNGNEELLTLCGRYLANMQPNPSRDCCKGATAAFKRTNNGQEPTSALIPDGTERPMKIYCNNNSIVLYSNNNRSSTKSNFIDIKFLIFIEHIGTSFMLVHPLTKARIPKK